MTPRVDHIEGLTSHTRKGAVENSFCYTIDYLLLDAEREPAAPSLFKRNRSGIFSLRDVDHGGRQNCGAGAKWVREILEQYSLNSFDIGRIEILAQPRILGHIFNPVSFWLVRDKEDRLRVVIPEVTNTYGDRHAYLCHHDDLHPIDREDTLRARKLLHVSPFQPVEGQYAFRFDLRDERIGIWIDYSSGDGGLLATLTGKRKPLTYQSIVRALVRRPFGSRRVLGLIHWQALKLWWKGAVYRARPTPPRSEVSR